MVDLQKVRNSKVIIFNVVFLPPSPFVINMICCDEKSLFPNHSPIIYSFLLSPIPPYSISSLLQNHIPRTVLSSFLFSFFFSMHNYIHYLLSSLQATLFPQWLCCFFIDVEIFVLLLRCPCFSILPNQPYPSQILSFVCSSFSHYTNSSAKRRPIIFAKLPLFCFIFLASFSVLLLLFPLKYATAKNTRHWRLKSN